MKVYFYRLDTLFRGVCLESGLGLRRFGLGLHFGLEAFGLEQIFETRSRPAKHQTSGPQNEKCQAALGEN